jgi:hypothetical protein
MSRSKCACVSEALRILVDTTTGRCNFPLLNGPIVDEPSLQEEDNTAISCKVCGMRHSISTGKVRQRQRALPLDHTPYGLCALYSTVG